MFDLPLMKLVSPAFQIYFWRTSKIESGVRVRAKVEARTWVKERVKAKIEVGAKIKARVRAKIKAKIKAFTSKTSFKIRWKSVLI